MKTVTVRELRNSFPKLEAWLAEGERIRIEKRGRPIAELRGLQEETSAETARPDFAARRKAIWGERVFSDAEVVEMRTAESDGEEG